MLNRLKAKYVYPYIPAVLIVLAIIYDELYSFVIQSVMFWLFTISYYFIELRSHAERYKWKKIDQEARRRFQFADSKPIKILSYNIFLRPPFIKNNRDDYKNERMREFMKKMRDYDIIALQEIFALGNTRQNQIINYAKEIGFHFHTRSFRPPLFSKKFIDAGLVILSKYPIVERDAMIYNFGNQIDAWAAKQVIYAKIQVHEDKYVHLFTTHMQATYFDSDPNLSIKSDKARLGQVDQYAEFVHKKIENSSDPALITGDFNVNAKQSTAANVSSEEYMYLINRMNSTAKSVNHVPIVDLVKEQYGFHPTTYADVHPDDSQVPREVSLTHPADHCTQLCLDYIFLLNSKSNEKSKNVHFEDTKVQEFFVENKSLPFSQLSDHYAVSTVLYVNKSN